MRMALGLKDKSSRGLGQPAPKRAYRLLGSKGALESPGACAPATVGCRVMPRACTSVALGASGYDLRHARRVVIADFTPALAAWFLVLRVAHQALFSQARSGASALPGCLPSALSRSQAGGRPRRLPRLVSISCSRHSMAAASVSRSALSFSMIGFQSTLRRLQEPGNVFMPPR